MITKKPSWKEQIEHLRARYADDVEDYKQEQRQRRTIGPSSVFWYRHYNQRILVYNQFIENLDYILRTQEESNSTDEEGLCESLTNRC